MINVDTVGTKEDLPLQIDGYEDSNVKIVQDFAGLAEKAGISYKIGTRGGTDHASFGEKNVEAVNLIHPDFNNGYHGPLDTIDDIDVLNIKKVIELIKNYLYEHAY